MNIFVLGSSILSSYWNGAATYYRGIYKYLAQCGHHITFAEPDAYNRQAHRDSGDFSYVESLVYQPTSGGGTSTITDFGSNDLLGVFGYGSTARAIVRGSSVSGGNTTISLRDNTNITLIGFTHLTTRDVVAA